MEGEGTETETHKFLKNKMAEALKEIGYNDVRTEYYFDKNARADVFAIDDDGEAIQVEIVVNHLPERLIGVFVNKKLAKLDGNAIRVSGEMKHQIGHFSNRKKSGEWETLEEVIKKLIKYRHKDKFKPTKCSKYVRMCRVYSTKERRKN